MYFGNAFVLPEDAFYFSAINPITVSVWKRTS